MTGHQEWVRKGIELGAEEILAALLELELQPNDSTAPEKISRLLMSRWPLWKVEATNQKEIILDCDAFFDHKAKCKRCLAILDPKHLHATPIGDICPICLGKYIRKEIS